MIATLTHSQLNYTRVQPSNKKRDDLIILFLHEALGSIGQWKTFPEELCNALGLEGIIYERQGHGDSSPLAGKRNSSYLHNYAFDELPQFLDAIEEKRPLLLVGHSDGGTISLLFASKFPQRVAGVVTMAAHVINEPETIAGIEPAIEAYKAGKLDGLQKYHGDKTESLFYAWANIWRDSSFEYWNISEEIKNIAGKGLFLQGADDQYGTAKQLELIVKGFGGSCDTYLVPNCGHHPHLEQKAITLDKILKWWDDQSD